MKRFFYIKIITTFLLISPILTYLFIDKKYIYLIAIHFIIALGLFRFLPYLELKRLKNKEWEIHYEFTPINKAKLYLMLALMVFSIIWIALDPLRFYKWPLLHMVCYEIFRMVTPINNWSWAASRSVLYINRHFYANKIKLEEIISASTHGRYRIEIQLLNKEAFKIDIENSLQLSHKIHQIKEIDRTYS